MKIMKKIIPTAIQNKDSKLSTKDFSYYPSLNQLQKFEVALNHCNYSLRQFRSILDFGCGDGRLTRHLFRLLPDALVYGSEIQPNLVKQCSKKFPRGKFIINNPTPPIDFSDNMFDFIFSYSIFTHLSESNHIAWLKELARTLKPGGIMAHTIHSYEYFKRISFFNPDSLAKYKLPCKLDDFIKKPMNYHWITYSPQTPEYGLTIISKDYVMKNWEKYSGLTLATYEEGIIESSPEGCHDLVLLAKK